MTQKCYVCNKYFYDGMDLINHMKESHKTHSFTALINYFESKLKRSKSFHSRDIAYILSFDLEKLLDRVITLEANQDIFYQEEAKELRSRVINLEMKPEIVCAKGTERTSPDTIAKLQNEVDNLKRLFFELTPNVSDLPLVPIGGGSEQQIKDRLKWLTHTDKRRGSKMIKTGYKDDHQAIMDELAPILERIYWENE